MTRRRIGEEWDRHGKGQVAFRGHQVYWPNKRHRWLEVRLGHKGSGCKETGFVLVYDYYLMGYAQAK